MGIRKTKGRRRRYRGISRMKGKRRGSKKDEIKKEEETRGE